MIPINPEDRKPKSKPLTWAGRILPNVSQAASERKVGTKNLIAIMKPKVAKMGNHSIEK
jgi:hypothetical protein